VTVFMAQIANVHCVLYRLSCASITFHDSTDGTCSSWSFKPKEVVPSEYIFVHHSYSFYTAVCNKSWAER
jgi:hypothetical protein